MPHDHTHSRNLSRKLTIATVLTVLFFGVELGVGIYANSLALIGDAFHNVTDAIALLLALMVIHLERRPPTRGKSFGYQKAGVLAAFVNASMLVGITVYLLVEAWNRFRVPEQVDSFWMLIAASVALVLNTAMTLWLRKEGRRDLSVRSAVIHLAGDALASAGVIIGALMIRATGSPVYDPVVSVLIAILILWSSYGILRETMNLLLEGTPSGIDPEAVTRDLAVEPGVFGVHHLHIWALGPSRPALSCHLMLGDVSLKSTGEILARVTSMLAERYQIVHTTIQFEHAGCALDDPLCVPDEQDLTPVGASERRSV
jgi:cobalt-zinc-cadmium efflux system protein